MRLVSLTLVIVLLTHTTATQSFADPPGFKSLAIGDRAPDFELPGVDDKPYSLKSFADARLLLVVFTCNHCPTAQAYESRIMKLHADYKDKGADILDAPRTRGYNSAVTIKHREAEPCATPRKP